MLRVEDLKFDWYRHADAQGVNQHANCVRVAHLPTGTVASCDEHRSYLKNKLEALRRLEEKLNAAQAA